MDTKVWRNDGVGAGAGAAAGAGKSKCRLDALTPPAATPPKRQADGRSAVELSRHHPRQ
jgi:hypothetical protein